MYCCKVILIIIAQIITQIKSQQFRQPTAQEIVDAQQYNERLQPFLEQVRLKNVLNYGDQCDFSIEEQRQALGKSFIDTLSEMNQIYLDNQQVNNDQLKFKFNERILQNFQSLSKLHGEFCSVFENLLCNSTGKCDCSVADLDPNVNVKFVREEGSCVLESGSICLPSSNNQQSSYSLQQNPFISRSFMNDFKRQEGKCSRFAPCRVVNSGEFCNYENSQKAIAKIMAEINQVDFSDEQRSKIFAQKMKDGICACDKGTIVTISSIIFMSLLFLIAF